jgi:glycine/D-amino acid oxidase-like deaminating enzyme
MHETGAAGGHTHDGEAPDDGRPRIAFVGAGHVGTALAVAFARAGWQVTAVASRDVARTRSARIRRAQRRAGRR